MRVQLHPRFQKERDRLLLGQQTQLTERLKCFRRNRADPLLRDHALTGKYQGYRSINVTGDIRAVYKLIDANTALFTRVGNHSQLYG